MSKRAMSVVRRAVVTAGIVGAVLMAGPIARALPGPGAKRPDVRLDDAWDRSLTLGRYRGMPTLVVYEDKDSAEENKVLKAELSELAKGDRYKKKIALVAVADVSSYDYWPVRGFVKDAIQAESHKQGTIIYCDWKGAVRRSLDLQKGVSNVVLYGKSDEVLFSHAGPMDKARRAELIGLLRREAGD